MRLLIQCILGNINALHRVIHFIHYKPLSEWAPEQQQQLRNSWVIKISLQHCSPRVMITSLNMYIHIYIFNINLKFHFPALRRRASSVLHDFHWLYVPFEELPPFKEKNLCSQIFCEKPKHNQTLTCVWTLQYVLTGLQFSLAQKSMSQVTCENKCGNGCQSASNSHRLVCNGKPRGSCPYVYIN